MIQLDPDGDRMGSLDVDLPREAFVHIVDGFGSLTGAAHTCLKALRAAYTWGQDRGFPSDSPVFRVKSGHKSKGGATSWSAEEVEKFLDRHAAGSMARLWFAMAYATHGRIGDMPFLGAGNIVERDDVLMLEWQPRKRGSEFVSIPLDPLLVSEWQLHDQARATFLITENGRPFASSGSLDNKVRDWIVAAGLVGDDGKANRSQHGIRKGVAELMASRGATEYELMSAFGWSDAKTAATYTKKYRRRAAAMSGMEKVLETQGGPRLEPRGPLSTKNTKNIKANKIQWQPVGESNPSFQVENLAS